MGRQDWIARMSWDAAAARLAAGAAAILPIGAAAKEHGRHLPMNTDELQAVWLAERLAARLNALIWPTVAYGFYPAFVDFPGSISLREETFGAMLKEIVEGIAMWRPRAVIVLDTGISTLVPAARAIAAASSPVPVKHLRIHAGARYRAAADGLRTQAFGGHADELETSRMLAMAPDVVNMAAAEATPAGPFAGPLTRLNAPSGSYGDPTLATAGKGHALWDAMLADLFEACGDGPSA